jgi:hypothetical protein
MHVRCGTLKFFERVIVRSINTFYQYFFGRGSRHYHEFLGENVAKEEYYYITQYWIISHIDSSRVENCFIRWTYTLDKNVVGHRVDGEKRRM